MKTTSIAVEVERSNVGVSSDFTIDATEMAFEILSSGLYSDKPGAIVRELACNAFDAHVAAGKKDLPIEIHMPTALDPTFYVKDYGIGLSDIQVRGGYQCNLTGEWISLEEGADLEKEDELHHTKHSGIYNTYFRSTKQDSNDFIGQLGLGSKSPFSYATAFNVESRHNGLKTLYSCYKNEQNKPSLVRMHSEPTDEPSGLTVTFAVRKEDVDRFWNAAKNKLMYFDPKPNVIGRSSFETHDLKHTVKGTNWAIRQAGYYAHMNGAYAVQGFVAYPIDKDRLIEGGLTGVAASLTEVDIDVFVSIGQVEVTPSRESLQYTKYTIENMIKVFRVAASEMRTSFQASFDACTSEFDAILLVDKFGYTGTAAFKKIFKQMHQETPFTYNGQPIPEHITLDLHNINATSIHSGAIVTSGRKRKVKKLTLSGKWEPLNAVTVKVELIMRGNTHILVDYDGKGTNTVVEQYLADQVDKDGREPTCLLLRTTNKRDAFITECEVKKLATQLGGATIIDLATTGYRKKVYGRSSTASTYTKRDAQSRLVWHKFGLKPGRRGDTIHRVFSRLTWMGEDIDLAQGGFYVALERFTPMDSAGHTFFTIDEVWEDAKMLELVPAGTKLVGMTEKELTAAQKSGKWVEFSSFCKKAFAKANADGRMSGKKVSSLLFHTHINVIVKTNFIVDAAIDKMVPGPFRTMMDKLRTVERNAADVNLKSYSRSLTRYNAVDVSITIAEELKADWAKMIREYPMLSMLNWATVCTGDRVNDIIDYINSVDSK